MFVDSHAHIDGPEYDDDRDEVVARARAAGEDTIKILHAEWTDAELRGVMHCFGGGWPLAEAALSLGFMISFAGNVTFKKAEALREIARRVPLERLLVETDCPFLATVPLRGRANETASVVETARFL